jgi:hypothetical protein
MVELVDRERFADWITGAFEIADKPIDLTIDTQMLNLG